VEDGTTGLTGVEVLLRWCTGEELE
jgi:hypothetical protein